jgi:uncharacterized protein YyaL (SSP411 family)
MERESFENPEIAAFLNERFVSVKVDREERPDVDDVYMTAVQAITGRGGWPLSAFLLPDGRPFFAGTYFPPQDRGGRLGFRSLLVRLAGAWEEDRRGLEAAADRILEEIENANRLPERTGERPLESSLSESLGHALKRSFDARFGGFSQSPKFPPHQALEYLLRQGAGGDQTALSMSFATLDAMALGGIHDHLGGGFHRYATDEHWLVPHFEKMLYDNAQLLCTFARAHALSGRSLHKRTAIAIGDYLLREMRGEEGGFYSATDADSEGEEGKFFTWTEKEIADVLSSDTAFFCNLYQVRPEGNYRDEATGTPTALNILHLESEPSSDEERRLLPLRGRLYQLRSGRVPPSLDDKRLSGWNSLAISGFALAGRLLTQPQFLEAARVTARFIQERMVDANGILLRTWKGGQAKIPAFLEDYAYWVLALCDLADSTAGEEKQTWQAEAHLWANKLLSRFISADGRGFVFAPADSTELPARGRDLFDKATPSAPAAAARALLRVASVTGNGSLAHQALSALREVSGLMARVPQGTETWHMALLDWFEFRSGHPEAAAVATRSSETPRKTEPQQARVAPVSLEVVLPSQTIRPGETGEIQVRLSIDDGWTVDAGDAFRVEAWAGNDIMFSPPGLPAPAQKDESTVYSGGFEFPMSFDVASRAATGLRSLSVLIRFRACGQERCEPERAVAVALPLEIAR